MESVAEMRNELAQRRAYDREFDYAQAERQAQEEDFLAEIRYYAEQVVALIPHDYARRYADRILTAIAAYAGVEE